MRQIVSSLVRHSVYAILPLALLVSALTSCVKSESQACAGGVFCPEGQRCSSDGTACIEGTCGDRKIQEGEVCDDGNISNGDGCNSDCTSTEICGNEVVDVHRGEVCDDSGKSKGEKCSADCRSKVECGNGIRDHNEECDDGNEIDSDDCVNCKMAWCGDGHLRTSEECDPLIKPEACNFNCTLSRCGDGIVTANTQEECDSGRPEDTSTCDKNCTVPVCGDGHTNLAAGEECDDGNKDDNDDCLSTCKWNRCGDGHINPKASPPEVCDDGNTETEVECPYGVQFCKNFCNENCSARLDLTGPYCGDEIVDDNEACDDGNNKTETQCPYDQSVCKVCNADCSQERKLTGARCGNGIQEQWEACDDGNNKSCGSCSATCWLKTPPPKATGRITVPASEKLTDGETFSLSDGIHERKVFEFTKDLQTEPGHVPISISNDQEASTMAKNIANVIQGLPDIELSISASASGNKVHLEHHQVGNFSEQPIQESVSDSGFSVKGMLSDGGTSYCPEGTGCATPEDCAFGLNCIENICTEP